MPQSSDNFYTSNMRRRYEFSSLFCLFGEEQDSLDLATCMVICEMVLPSTSVEILTVYSVFSSKPSNRQLYLYMEANANPNSSCVISVKKYDFLVFFIRHLVFLHNPKKMKLCMHVIFAKSVYRQRPRNLRRKRSYC